MEELIKLYEMEAFQTLLWIMVGVGAVVNMCMLYIIRSYLDKDERCNSLWYVVAGLLSWPGAFTALIVVTAASYFFRKDP